MRALITIRLPCSFCGLDTFDHDGWFLVVENRWLDRLKILSWHPSLATQKEVKSACSRQHLKTLIAHWLNQASLRLAPGPDLPVPIAGEPFSNENPTPEALGQVVGELSVHREAFSLGWTGSPATLECILDALIPGEQENQTYTMQLSTFPPLGRSSMDSAYSKALAEVRWSL